MDNLLTDAASSVAAVLSGVILVSRFGQVFEVSRAVVLAVAVLRACAPADEADQGADVAGPSPARPAAVRSWRSAEACREAPSGAAVNASYGPSQAVCAERVSYATAFEASCIAEAGGC